MKDIHAQIKKFFNTSIVVEAIFWGNRDEEIK